MRARAGEVEVYYGGTEIARYAAAARKDATVRQAGHHAGIALGARQERRTLVHLKQTAPVVEIRPLAEGLPGRAAGAAHEGVPGAQSAEH